MRHLTLEDALALVVLYAEAGDEKFERAACRWLSRLTIERKNLTVGEAHLAAAALAALEDAPLTAATTLRSSVAPSYHL